MKLKYILPVTAIASVATIVTPLATSCSKSSTVKWEAGETLKLSYSPLSPEKVSYTSYDDCNKDYAEFIKENPRAFAEGVALWFVQGHLRTERDPEHASNDITKLEITVDNIDTTMSDRKDSESFESTSSKSFKISLSGHIDAWFKFGEQKIEFKDSYFELKNIPIYYDARSTAQLENPVRSLGDDKFVGWWTDNDDWSANLPEVTMSGSKFVVGENKTFDRNSAIPEEDPESISSFTAWYIMDYLTASDAYTHVYSEVYTEK